MVRAVSFYPTIQLSRVYGDGELHGLVQQDSIHFGMGNGVWASVYFNFFLAPFDWKHYLTLPDSVLAGTKRRRAIPRRKVPVCSGDYPLGFPQP